MSCAGYIFYLRNIRDITACFKSKFRFYSIWDFTISSFFRKKDFRCFHIKLVSGEKSNCGDLVEKLKRYHSQSYLKMI